MHTFVRVVESGSFTAVARELDTTQSAISKQVAWLEAELGETLMVRTTRSRSLTEAGQLYFEEARRLLAEITDLEQLIRSGPQRLRGSLRVAASVTMGERLLLPVVKQFLSDNPELRVDLRLSDAYIDLVEQGIDVAVRIGRLGDTRLYARQVGNSQRLLVAAPEYLARCGLHAGALTHPQQLTAHECLVYTGTSDPSAWEFLPNGGTGRTEGDGEGEADSRVVVRVSGRLQTNSSAALRTAILEGHGIGFTPDWMFTEDLAQGRVVALMPQWRPAALPIYAMTTPERRGSMRVQRLLDAMQAGLLPT